MPVTALGGAALEEWRDAARPFFRVRPLGAATDFFGEAAFRLAGGLAVTNVRFSAQRMEHDPRHLKAFDHDFLLLERYRSGAGRGVVDGVDTRIDAGTMHLVDLSRHYVTMTTDVAAEGALIPHAAVGYDPSAHPAYVSVRLDSGAGGALALALDALSGAAGGDSRGAGEDLGAAFAALVGTLLLGAPDEHDAAAERGRKRLLNQYIMHNLHEPSLGAERICRDLGMSRASLYRALAAEGGVRKHITDLRLDRCFGDLVRSPGCRGQVRTIAEHWGFFDPASFCHSFRRRFGVKPSDCLGSAATGDNPDPGPGPGATAVSRSLLDWVRAR